MKSLGSDNVFIIIAKSFPGLYKERDPNPRSIKGPKIGRWLSGWEHVVVLPEDLELISQNSHAGSQPSSSWEHSGFL